MSTRKVVIGAIVVLSALFLPLFILGIIVVLYGFIVPRKWRWPLWIGGSIAVVVLIMASPWLLFVWV